MADKDNELIDLCSEYVTDRECSYLAKEGYIVNYMSTTGRKTDYMWHKHTITETLRIIKAMRLTANQAKDLKEHHLIAAFQELGKVYEFGVKTRHVAAQGIFNYSEHSEMSIGDEAMSLLVERLQIQGFTAVLMQPVINLFEAIQGKLKLDLKASECRDLLYKHFEGAGYTVKTGAYRPLIQGRKQPAIMMNGTKPAEVTGIPTDTQVSMVAKIYGELV